MRLRPISLATAMLLALTACSVADQPTDVRRQAEPSATSTARLEPAVRPTELTCADGQTQVVSFDYRGDRRFSDLLAIWTRELGRPLVDRGQSRIWFLRDDGTAHSVLDWTRAAGVDNGRPWFVDGYESCRDSGRWRDVAAPATPVDLRLGSCWIDPIRIGDQTWDFAEEELGVRQRQPLTLRGEVRPAGDVATYTDESGRRITLVPQGDPWAVERGVCN